MASPGIADVFRYPYRIINVSLPGPFFPADGAHAPDYPVPGRRFPDRFIGSAWILPQYPAAAPNSCRPWRETTMKPLHLAVIALLAVFILAGGCMESPIKEPTVTVGEIALSDISLQKMTVNTTVLIYNPNPIGARLNKVAFDVYYPDNGQNYLGHGEQTNIDVKANDTTSVTIPVTVGTLKAAGALGSLLQKGSITLDVNGSAFVDVKVTSFEKPFRQSKTFTTKDLESVLPVASLTGGSVNVTEKLGQLQGFLSGIS
jgi:LEA14-like dessication related protein